MVNMTDEKLRRLEELKLEVLSRPSEPLPADHEPFDPRGWRFLPLSNENYDYCICDTCGARGWLYATHFAWEYHKPGCRWSNRTKGDSNGTDAKAD